MESNSKQQNDINKQLKEQLREETMSLKKEIEILKNHIKK